MSEGRKIGWKRRKLNELALNQESLWIWRLINVFLDYTNGVSGKW
jgi:hypothetical protein